MTELLQKATGALARAFDREGRRFSGTATTEAPDRMGDSVTQGPLPDDPEAGIDLRDFKRNPALLASHNSHELPVGVVEAFTPKLSVRPRRHDFVARIAKGPAGDALLELVGDGVLRATSIGFRVLRARRPTPADEKRLGAELEGVVFLASELLELSLVSIPANADALVQLGLSSPRAWRGELERLHHVETVCRRALPGLAQEAAAAARYLERLPEHEELLEAARQLAAKSARRRRLGLSDPPPRRFALSDTARASLWEASRNVERRDLERKVAAIRSSHR